MKFFKKNYKKIKTENFMKENKLFFFIFNSYLNVHEWTLFKQQLKSKNFNSLISAKVWIKKIVYSSIYSNFLALNSQILILICFKNRFLLSKIVLPMLAIKLNKNIYNKNQLINNCSFHYINNKLILFKFSITHLKLKSK